MKSSLHPGMFFLLLLATLFQGCKKEVDYKPLPYAVYMGDRPTNLTTGASATNLFNTVSFKKTVPGGFARVYVNQLYEKDVTVSFALSGTAVAGTDYQAPAATSVTIPAGAYYGEITFNVLNNPALTANKTVIFTLTSATENFALGIGSANGYKTFTYTITP